MAKRKLKAVSNAIVKAIAKSSPEAKMAVRATKQIVRMVKTIKRKRNTRAKSGKTSRQISAPVSVGMSTSVTPLSISSNGDVKTVSGTEIFHVFSGNVGEGYTVTSYNINPLEAWWPLLASECTMYQMWRLVDLEFIYESLAPTTLSGLVHIGQVTDPNDSAPPSYEDLSSYPRTVTNPVWQSFSWRPQKDSNWRYTNGTSSGDAETRQLIAFKVFVGTYGIHFGEYNSPPGSFKVRYSIQLSKRIPSTDLSQYFLDFNQATTTTTLPSTRWFSATAEEILFKARGKYRVSIIQINDTDTAPSTPTSTNTITTFETEQYFSTPGMTDTNGNIWSSILQNTVGEKIKIELPPTDPRRLFVSIAKL